MRAKQLLLLLAVFLFTANVKALIPEHGSMQGNDLVVYDVAGGITEPTPFTTAEMNINYKLVTIGNNPYVWVQNTGSWAFNNANYGVQLRFWGNAGDYTASPMVKSSGQQEYCFSGVANRIPPTGAFKESIGFPGGWSQGGTGWSTNEYITLYFYSDRETNFIHYNKTAKNSAVEGDVTAPTKPSVTMGDVEETTASFTLSSSDDNDYFYYLTGNGMERVLFKDNVTLTSLADSTEYTFQVTAVDFSGNESDVETIHFTTKGLYNVTSGETDQIRFVFKSTASVLEYYYEYKDPAKTFRDASLKITRAGDAQFEVKPTVSPDGKYCYGSTDDARINNKVLTLALGYFEYKEPLNYDEYVINVTQCTVPGVGVKPIMHQMNGAIASEESEAVAPVLNSVSLQDATDNYIKLNIDGSDNSGVLYYEITGAKSTVKSFVTGDYYLTAIDPGHLYNLSVKAYDLSGNSSSSQSVSVKTTAARSNVVDNQGMAYNNVAPTTAPELVSVITQSGNTLTLGCTTASALITNGDWKDRVFNTPTVRVDGTDYPLTRDENNTTATVTFTDQIGSKDIVSGTSFSIRWSVYWGEEGGGNFFTGTYSYVVGDNGQVDTTAPSAPDLNLSGNTLSWPASTDDLSGVKYYIVSESGQPEVTIWDLNEESFEYVMDNTNNETTVAAYDFAGNSNISKVIDGGVWVGNNRLQSIQLSLYPNPATDIIYFNQKVQSVILYSLQGQSLLSASHVNKLDISRIVSGLYIVKAVDANGKIVSTKIEVR